MTDYANALPAGFRLHEYEIVRELGEGGFGITYLGYDHNLDKAVAIKEYLPSDLAVRDTSRTVVPRSTQRKADFVWGLERFLDEARMLARFDHPNLIRVSRFFEAHGTAYIVMDYAEGETLSELMRRRGKLDEAGLKGILLPILDGLERVHAAGVLHRDIKPGNIILRADGSPVLIDFGAARQAVGAKSRSVTSIVTPGYAPIEQYSTKGHQGPWTDIYALAAVSYRALTGRDPEDATERMRDDPLAPLVSVCRGEASETFLKALDWALSVDERDRPQDVAAFRAALLGGALPAGAEQPGGSSPPPSAAARSGAVRPKAVVWVLVGAGAIGLVVLLGWLARDEESPAVVQTQEAPVRSEPVGTPAVVERREVVTPTVQVEPPAPSELVTPPVPMVASPPTYALTVAAEPGDATIRVLNIGPRYQAGMQLEPGRYHIEVSKAGYETHREWLEVVDQDVLHRLSLVRRTAHSELTGELVDIPGGTFRMGDLIGDGVGDGDRPNERPVRTVTIRPFRLGKTEVTVAQWSRYRSASPTAQPGCGEGPQYPVACVSFADVQEYLGWINAQTGGNYRLPSEAEWEYAARAGTATRYPWGNEFSRDQANGYGVGRRDRWEQAAPVGSFPANNFGLYDMIGNVREWTEDCLNLNYEGAPSDGRAWLSGECFERIQRGGAWSEDGAALGVYYRDSYSSATFDGRSGLAGFRLAQQN